jgi:histidine triad (HIT) family protein
MTKSESRNRCPFCAIARGTASAAVVWADDIAVAFLDARPLFPGHCLVAPQRHIQTLGELDHELIEPLFVRIKRMSQAVEQAMDSTGSFVAINNRVSQSVPHLHVHVAPRNPGDGLRGFFWPRRQYQDHTHMEKVRQKIRTAYMRL